MEIVTVDEKYISQFDGLEEVQRDLHVGMKVVRYNSIEEFLSLPEEAFPDKPTLSAMAEIVKRCQ